MREEGRTTGRKKHRPRCKMLRAPSNSDMILEVLFFFDLSCFFWIFPVFLNEGRKERWTGRKEGRKEGRKDGQEGRKEGRKEGKMDRKEGRKKGRKERRKERSKAIYQSVYP